MATEINGYINPFSSDFQASASHYHDMSTGSQILTIFFSALAFLVSIPLLGVAGFAAFRSLVDRLAPIDASHNKTTKKVDAVAEKKKIKPESAVARRRRTTKTQVISLLNRLDLQMQKAQSEFSVLSPETLLDDELETNVDQKKKIDKLSQLANLYKTSQTEISAQILLVKKKTHLLPKSQQTDLLERLERAQTRHQQLEQQIFSLLVKLQPKIAKIFLDIHENFKEEIDLKIKKENDESLEKLDAICFLMQDLFEKIQKEEEYHCEVSSLPTTSESQGVLPWFFSLIVAALPYNTKAEPKGKIHELVMEPAKNLQGKVSQEMSLRLVEKRRVEARTQQNASSRSRHAPKTSSQQTKRLGSGKRTYGTFASRYSRVARTPQPGGLNNLGNTCFMNSSLQVILNTNLAKLIDRDLQEPSFSDYYHLSLSDELLTQYLLNPESIVDNMVLKSAVKNYLGAVDEYPRIKAHHLALQKLKAVYTGKDTTISLYKALSDLRSVVISPRTRLVELPPSYSQQDAGEFLSAALRGIAFHFNMRKKIASDDGKDTSETAEITHYLSIPLVKKEVVEDDGEHDAQETKPVDKGTGKAPTTRKGRHYRRPVKKYQSDFQEMLEAYKVEHKDDPDNKWMYIGFDAVREHQKYSQTYEIVDQIPDTLVVQVKRFQYNNFGRISSKDSTPLVIGEEVDFRTLIDESLLVDDVSTRYKVVGIVNHGGGIGGGHYTADVKIDGKWENRSDSSVIKNLSEQTSKSHLQNGYIFVFERIK